MGLGLKIVNEGEWSSVRRNFQRLGSILLGPTASPTWAGLTLTGLTASRLASTDASKGLASVSNLASWVAGTANEVDVADDGDGTITIGIVNPLIVGKGGTGVATLTDHGLLLGSGTDAVTPLGVATNGQLPIGSTGADPVLGTLTGTANQITVTNTAGGITLSLPSAVVIGHTVVGACVLRLNNASDVCRMIWDVEGLSGEGRQSWGMQTDRAVNGDFEWARGTVGTTPLTSVLYSDPSGNIGIGKYSPATKLDVNGVITATGLTTAGTVNASAGKVLVKDNDTSEPGGENDGYIGVSIIGGEARIYFTVNGTMYYVTGTASSVPTTGNPIGLLLVLTYS